ncbi:MarR family transcriptional regulator [Clostridium sp. MSJ-11]|uniref:MarR family transcriptional regulator n=1 Tax=Clostridium mobile TaxID=2841512 RepID=A0ABS6EIW3_9CLOT|nr:MarR family transcriptional regulator [Clostridium mobile]MBU5484631.1 MarR family transcriptional regulator [Clostridium mobile]
MSEENSVDRYIHSIMLEMLNVQQKSKAFIEFITKNGTLSQNHLMLMIELKLLESMRITEISERFFVTAGAATSMCDKLEEQGLICRIRTKEDRRVVLVTLTQKGEDKINDLFKSFPKEKLIQIENVFKEVNALMSSIIE